MNATLDLDAVEHVIDIKLGGKQLVARETTVEKNKEILRQIAEAEEAERDNGDSDSAKVGLRNLESIYDQVKEILVDPKTGKPPTRGFIEKHMTSARLKALMERLNEGDDEGK